MAGWLARFIVALSVALSSLPDNARGGSVGLAWDAVAHPGVAGYAIHIGPAQGVYVSRRELGDVTSYIVDGLDEGANYHFAVTAYDFLGRESGYSNDVGALVPFSAPVADFGASVTSGPAPLVLNFIAETTGTIESFDWTFGDGSTSQSRNPVHTYTTPGAYTVGLTVAGPGGTHTRVKRDYVNVTAGAPGVGGLLAVERAPSPAVLDLGQFDSLDWVHWATGTRKAAGGAQISDLAAVGRDANFTASTISRTTTWSDGAAGTSGSSGATLAVSGIGRGFQLSVPADTTPRMLTLYVGASSAVGRLSARLSDDSAAAVTSVSIRKMTSTWAAAYRVTFRAASAGQRLTVQWTLARGKSVPGEAGSRIDLQAAVLTRSETP